jgi:putative Mg2+ transporter-C (MgtC) family protein
MIFVDIPIWEAASRLGVAAVLGLVVGFEREFRRKPAGLRTYMLVAVGSAAFMILTLELAAGPVLGLAASSVDPSRIIQGIIGGIGFLGAGAIIQGGREVMGMTTGASIWTAGAIGIASGIGFLDFALLLTVLVVVIVFIVGKLENGIMSGVEDVTGLKRPKEGHDEPE